MKLRVLYFAGLRERLGRSQDEFDVPAAINSVSSLRSWLMQQGEPWRAAFSGTRGVRAAVDQSVADDATALHENAEVAFFPPVTGG